TNTAATRSSSLAATAAAPRCSRAPATPGSPGRCPAAGRADGAPAAEKEHSFGITPRARAARSQRLTPIFQFSQHLGAIAALTVDDASAEAVLGPYFVLWDDVLKIPCRVGGLLAIVDAAAAGRMGEADAVAAIEHDDVSLLLEEAVVERFV